MGGSDLQYPMHSESAAWIFARQMMAAVAWLNAAPTENAALRSLGQSIGRIEEFGWGTWIRTKIDGVRVRSSTIELFPSRPEPAGGGRSFARRGVCIDNAGRDCKRLFGGCWAGSGKPDDDKYD